MQGPRGPLARSPARPRWLRTECCHRSILSRTWHFPHPSSPGVGSAGPSTPRSHIANTASPMSLPSVVVRNGIRTPRTPSRPTDKRHAAARLSAGLGRALPPALLRAPTRSHWTPPDAAPSPSSHHHPRVYPSMRQGVHPRDQSSHPTPVSTLPDQRSPMLPCRPWAPWMHLSTMRREAEHAFQDVLRQLGATEPQHHHFIHHLKFIRDLRQQPHAVGNLHLLPNSSVHSPFPQDFGAGTDPRAPRATESIPRWSPFCPRMK
jgi:hypothetical protein